MLGKPGAGWHPVVFAEEAIEMGDVLKSARERSADNGMVALLQKLRRVDKTQFGEGLEEGLPGDFPEELRELPPREAGRAGSRIKIPVGVEGSFHAIENACHASVRTVILHLFGESRKADEDGSGLCADDRFAPQLGIVLLKQHPTQGPFQVLAEVSAGPQRRKPAVFQDRPDLPDIRIAAHKCL